jgi:hypothetical protein
LFLHNNPPDYEFQFITNAPIPAPITSFFPAASGPTPATYFLFSVNPHEKTPSYQQWNLAVERQLGREFKLQVTYVGGKGTDLSERINANQAVLGTSPEQSRRPYPQFGDILESNSMASSNYNSIQASLSKTLSHGLSLSGSYVHANAFDYADTEAYAPQNRLDLKAEYGPSLFLVRNRFVFNATWELPLGKGHELLGSVSNGWNKVIGGWQVSSITLLQGGTPMTITANNLSDTGGFIAFRADTTCNGSLSKSVRSLKEFFNVSCFSQPPNNTFGNSRRGQITGPGLNNNDISLTKRVDLVDGIGLRFDAQFFNAFNHPQFDVPVTVAGASNFGGTGGALAGRDIQFGLKLLF